MWVSITAEFGSIQEVGQLQLIWYLYSKFSTAIVVISQIRPIHHKLQ